jgi:hypothetical protein
MHQLSSGIEWSSLRQQSICASQAVSARILALLGSRLGSFAPPNDEKRKLESVHERQHQYNHAPIATLISVRMNRSIAQISDGSAQISIHDVQYSEWVAGSSREW